MSKALRVLITGAARGIGMATAQVLANRGHSVVATDLSAPSALEGIQTHVLDVTSDDSVARCLKEVGPLDAIVNNAGIFGGGPVEGYPLDRIRQMFETNTRPAAELVPDPEKAKTQLRLLYLSCGNKDGLIRISQGVHGYLKEKNVPHIWHVDDHGHDFQHWKKALYNFAQLIFKPTTN